VSASPRRPVYMGTHGVIVAGHYLGAMAGNRMFERGGNAIDAGVASGFALAVLEPAQFSIGGEAPILLRQGSSGHVVAISGQGQAPRAATVQRFREMGLALVPGDGLLAATVPAVVGTLATALAHFGTRSLSEVLAPAIDLATGGFGMYPYLKQLLVDTADRMRREWPTSADVFLTRGAVPELGSLLKQPELAATLQSLADAEDHRRALGDSRTEAILAASDHFYRGPVAHALVDFCQGSEFPDASGHSHHGLLALEDFAAYTTRLEEPVGVDYRGYQVFKCGPWTQGPVFLQQLRLLEGFDLRAMGHNSPNYIHTLVEAAKLAFSDRERYYGDPLFVNVPLDQLLSAEYAEQRRRFIDPVRASVVERSGDAPVAVGAGGQSSHTGDTTHLDTMDSLGNMMSITPSGGWCRSSPLAPGLGFALGTRLQMFWLDEDHPSGLRPGKRPRTTLTPSLVLKDGKPSMVFGTRGGDAQDQWTLQFFLNVVEFGMDVQEAVEAPNFYTEHFHSSFYPRQAFPGRLSIEDRVPVSVREELTARGHRIRVEDGWSGGCVTGIHFDPLTDVMAAAASPRNEKAYAVGW
jgi:gamma-glutamyltranspeptidase / glutathione hydrolase